jgi:membrane protein DedA with SNARE-associated domain
MGLIAIFLALFVFLTCMDCLFFYLGKRGILEYLRKREWGKKIYSLAHKKAKRMVHKSSSISVVIAKLTSGGTIVALLYLGEHIKFRKFIFVDMIMNFLFCLAIWTLVVFFSFSFSGALKAIGGIQKEILLIVISIIIFVLIDKFFDRKISNFIRLKKN